MFWVYNMNREGVNMKNIVLGIIFIALVTVSLIREPIGDSLDLIAGATSPTYSTQIDLLAGASEPGEGSTPSEETQDTP